MGSSKNVKVAAPTGMVDDVEAGLTGATVANAVAAIRRDGMVVFAPSKKSSQPVYLWMSYTGIALSVAAVVAFLLLAYVFDLEDVGVRVLTETLNRTVTLSLLFWFFHLMTTEEILVTMNHVVVVRRMHYFAGKGRKGQIGDVAVASGLPPRAHLDHGVVFGAPETVKTAPGDTPSFAPEVVDPACCFGGCCACRHLFGRLFTQTSVPLSTVIDATRHERWGREGIVRLNRERKYMGCGFIRTELDVAEPALFAALISHLVNGGEEENDTDHSDLCSSSSDASSDTGDDW